jgi:hypothetical protein
MAGAFTERAAPDHTKVIRTHVDGRQEMQEMIVVDLNEGRARSQRRKISLLIVDRERGPRGPESFF